MINNISHLGDNLLMKVNEMTLDTTGLTLYMYMYTANGRDVSLRQLPFLYTI